MARVRLQRHRRHRPGPPARDGRWPGGGVAELIRFGGGQGLAGSEGLVQYGPILWSGLVSIRWCPSMDTCEVHSEPSHHR
jgi:hypothetical protein